MSMAFQGIRTFFKTLHSVNPSTRYVVLGLPLDCATTNRSGSRLGPNAIRSASAMLTDGVCNEWPVDITPHVTDMGDLSISTGNTLCALQEIQSVMTQLHAANHHVVSMGGDHSVTLGILRSLRSQYPKIACIHLDAHCDTWMRHDQQPIGHGTWLYNAVTEGLVDPSMTWSLGVRSPADKTTSAWLTDHGGYTINSRQLMRQNDPTQLAQAIHNICGDTPVYLTLDIDCLDPSYAPGTGTPEISGLSTMWVDEFIDACHELNFVGMDCVEVAPAYDHSEITALAAASFCWRYLSQQIWKNNQNN